MTREEKIDIVDRLTFALMDSTLHPSTVSLLAEARDEIHRLQGMVWSLPPTCGMKGQTWREDYLGLWDRILNTTPEQFVEWRSLFAQRNSTMSATED